MKKLKLFAILKRNSQFEVGSKKWFGKGEVLFQGVIVGDKKVLIIENSINGTVYNSLTEFFDKNNIDRLSLDYSICFTSIKTRYEKKYDKGGTS